MNLNIPLGGGGAEQARARAATEPKGHNVEAERLAP